jgi:hypothetical protein
MLSGVAALIWKFLEKDFQGAFGFACWVIAVLNTVMAELVVKWRPELGDTHENCIYYYPIYLL